METFAQCIAHCLTPILGFSLEPIDLEIPPDPELGDFAFPCFKLTKQFKKPPPKIAQEIMEKLQKAATLPPKVCVSTSGAYLNFSIKSESLFRALLKDILSGDGLGNYAILPPNTRETWVLEYSSPNIAKPLNIYHLRPTALGAALDRIGRARGYQMVSINHLGDWGKQYGMLSVALKHYEKSIDSISKVKELVDLYIKIHADAEKDPTLEEKAKEAFLNLERGDTQMQKIWEKCVEISVKEFKKNYERLNVHFDYILGESQYRNQLPSLLQKLRQDGLLIQSEGAWVIPVNDPQGQELPPCLLEKSDGATLYATRDLAAALDRYEKFQFNRMTYIVGAEQKLHFHQLFSVLKKMGKTWASHCEHIPTGLYRFKDAKMSTRKGNFLTLEEVLSLVKEKVTDLMEEKENEKPFSEKEAIIEAITVGAVLFYDLYTDPARDIDFDIERITDFEGETGPYLQYAHTRCLSIIKKAHQNPLIPKIITYQEKWVPLLKAPEELSLIKTLGQLSMHLEKTLKYSKASQLAHFLIEVARVFGRFYRECHVLTPDLELTQARLMLVEATRRVLARGLTLLGIPLPKWM